MKKPLKKDWTARRVKSLRQRMGKTQTEFAEELGVRQQTVSEWETGLYAPRGASSTLLKRVAEDTGFYKAKGDSEGGSQS